MSWFDELDSPVGTLLLVADAAGLRRVEFPRGRHPVRRDAKWQRASEPLARVRAQLEEYFAGKRRAFELELAPEGTPFQLRVWAALRAIPYGRTTSYGDLARTLGDPSAVRAVGAANGRNPLPIVVPCHRVIGADGSMVGFGGGLDTKRWLLAHEGASSGEDLFT